jgi:hypothetical protein
LESFVVTKQVVQKLELKMIPKLVFWYSFKWENQWFWGTPQFCEVPIWLMGEKQVCNPQTGGTSVQWLFNR